MALLERADLNDGLAGNLGSGLDAFSYSGLSARSIRLFTLFPGPRGSELMGKLTTSNVDEPHQPYFALSYAWGPRKLSHRIVCEGKAILITANQFSVLQRLRKSQQKLVLWIDAVCINQSTEEPALRERSYQVSMMNEIFTNADKVIIDLGDTDKDFKHLMALLKEYTDWGDDLKFLRGLKKIICPFCKQADIHDREVWLQYIQLIEIQWFRRLWCFQEFVLAHDVVILLGENMIDDLDIHLGLSIASCRMEAALEQDFIRDSLFEFMASLQGWTRARHIILGKWSVRKRRKTTSLVPFGPVWAVSRTMDVSDRKDRVFALHGMLSKDVTKDLHIDYMESFESLQRRFTSFLIRKGLGCFVLMHSVGHGKTSPSWLLRIDVENIGTEQDLLLVYANSYGDFKHESGLLRACAESEADIRLLTGTNQLLVKGDIRDAVQAVGPYLNKNTMNDMDDGVLDVTDYFPEMLSWARNLGIEVDDDKFRRVLVFDCVDENYVNHDLVYFREDSLLRRGFQCWVKWFDFSEQDQHEDEEQKEEEQVNWKSDGEAMKMFMATFSSCVVSRRIVMLDSGGLAIVPFATEVGDEIAIFEGVPVPFVLRREEKSDQKSLIGSCFAEGMMEGEELKSSNWSSKYLCIS